LALHAWTRDAPVDLSDSGLETRQIIRQPVLLDPYATISIDLRKRLFLLVTGRGE
jgi:hypothetical protein